MYVFVAFQRASRKIGSPIELPSLNKDFTYLLTYLHAFERHSKSNITLQNCDLSGIIIRVICNKKVSCVLEFYLFAFIIHI